MIIFLINHVDHFLMLIIFYTPDNTYLPTYNNFVFQGSHYATTMTTITTKEVHD